MQKISNLQKLKNTKIMKNKLLAGLIIVLTFSTICSALTLSGIEQRIDSINRRISLIKAPEIVAKIPSTSLTRLKKDLVDLSQPIDELNKIRIDLENIKRLLSLNIDEISRISNPGEIEACRMRINALMMRLIIIEKSAGILKVHEDVRRLKADHRYIKLVTSNSDALGLSKNITICQSGPSRSMYPIFNYLRSRSRRELALIRLRSSPEASAVLDIFQINYGNSATLKGVANGVAPNCLWGMTLAKFDLVPYDGFSCVKRSSPNDHCCGMGFCELGKIASEFGLILGVSIECRPKIGPDLELSDIERTMIGLPNGDYIVRSECHYIFLEKTFDEIIVYNSSATHSVIAGEVFGFSYRDEEAMKHLLEIANYNSCMPEPRIGILEFRQITDR